jgi:hypothetical protein
LRGLAFLSNPGLESSVRPNLSLLEAHVAADVGGVGGRISDAVDLIGLIIL